MRPAAALLIFVSLVLFSHRALAAPAPVALLPSIGPASEDDRQALDTALREALADTDDVDLLPAGETRGHLTSLAELGLVCSADDVPCLVKLGAVAGVSWVIVPTVDKPSGGEIKVKIDVIDVAGAKRARTVDERVSLDDKTAVASLALRAMGLEAAPPDKPILEIPPDQPPPDGGPIDDPPDDPAEGEGEGEGPPPEVEPPSTGAILIGVGGVVAGVSALGATISELVYADIITADAKTRRNVQPLGAVLWGTTVLGAATIVVGIYLLTEDSSP